MKQKKCSYLKLIAVNALVQTEFVWELPMGGGGGGYFRFQVTGMIKWGF